MDVYQFRSFVVLSEHLHFGRAAKALNLSQPALTKQIRRLEEEVGSPLFERARGATRLSAVGLRWLPEVKEVLARFERAEAVVRKLAGGTAGRLNVGFGFHTLAILPAMIAKLRVAMPEVQVTLRDMSSAEQAVELESGDLDIGFVRMPVGDRSRYEVLPVIEDRLALVTSDRVPRGARVRLADCRDLPFVSISRDRAPGFYNHVLNLCTAHGFHPRIVQEVHEFTTAIALVRAGMGVTMIPESIWTGRMAGVEMHPIDDRRAVWKVAAVWRRGDTNPVLAHLVRLVRSTAAARP